MRGLKASNRLALFDGGAQSQPLATASKVPAATAFFWIIKILTTGMGETTSDFLLNKTHHAKLAQLVIGLALAAAVTIQVYSRKYHAARYWAVVIFVAIFGTMVADVIDFKLHLPLITSTALFGTLVSAVLLVWWTVEGTLSIHSIFSRRRESFYWATVLTTFILGTAAGDLTAFKLHLGFLGSGVVFVAMILVPLVAHRVFKVKEVVCFWTAYILTRPLGASFADWMSSSHSGGLAMGPLKTSLVWAAAIAAMVACAMLRRSKELPTAETDPHCA